MLVYRMVYLTSGCPRKCLIYKDIESTERLAGAPGFEPGNGGIKIRCLTTWLRPHRYRRATAKQFRARDAGADGGCRRRPRPRGRRELRPRRRRRPSARAPAPNNAREPRIINVAR